ncbi:hypothetical protein THRCLA_00085 [Thraustotheca clavata]|uniref:Ankyrin repeat protein n=1 Tax=Thraustotheca clavata TaxID=74557 RepID=A0A1W0ACM7_9STRA|nr:hypothetical protein THRCLA_00085 [Thraustotheca clavata]
MLYEVITHHGDLNAVEYVLDDPRLLKKTIHDAITEMTFVDTFCGFTMISWMDQHKMSMKNVHDVIKIVVQHPKYDIADRDNRIFRWFCAYGEVKMVKRLLKDPRVDPSAKDSVALYLAMYNEEMTKVLLEDGRVDPVIAAEKYPPGKIFVE